MRTSLSLVLLVTLACGGDDTPLHLDTAAAGPAAAPAARDQPSSAWTVDAGGAGPVRVGMPAAELRTALGGTLTNADSAGECGYATSSRAPAGMRFMRSGARIVRIDVDSGSISTAVGIRVGDSEADVHARYGERVVESPHKYTNGRYLTVSPPADAAGADTATRIVFETDGAKVTRYRAGLRPYVEWVEGCG